MKLKKNVNLWEVNYKIDDLNMSTGINSGMIDDYALIEQHFKSIEPEAKHIKIRLIKEE